MEVWSRRLGRLRTRPSGSAMGSGGAGADLAQCRALRPPLLRPSGPPSTQIPQSRPKMHVSQCAPVSARARIHMRICRPGRWHALPRLALPIVAHGEPYKARPPPEPDGAKRTRELPHAHAALGFDFAMGAKSQPHCRRPVRARLSPYGYLCATTATNMPRGPVGADHCPTVASDTDRKAESRTPACQAMQ